MSSLHYDSADRPASTPINAEHVYLEGDCIVVPDGYVFPPICLVTGERMTTPPKFRRYARTQYVSEADIAPGSLAGLLAGRQRAHFGPKSTVSFCLSERLENLHRNLLIGATTCLLLAFPLPIMVAVWTKNYWGLALFPVLMAGAGFCIWKRDAIFHTRKVTPSFLWLACVDKAVREAVYQSGCREKKT